MHLLPTPLLRLLFVSLGWRLEEVLAFLSKAPNIAADLGSECNKLPVQPLRLGPLCLRLMHGGIPCHPTPTCPLPDRSVVALYYPDYIRKEGTGGCSFSPFPSPFVFFFTKLASPPPLPSPSQSRE